MLRWGFWRGMTAVGPMTGPAMFSLSFLTVLLTILLAILLAPVGAGPASAQVQSQDRTLRVAYLIPGSDKEPFWQNAQAFAEAAAEDFGFSLEVHYAFNDAKRLLDLGKQIANRPQGKPHYMIFHNYEGAAPFILNETERNGVFAFLIGTGLSPSVRDQVKGPRENFRFWLGEIKTDHVGGGHELAQILFRTAHNKGLTSASGRLKMILINGSAGDVAAVDRQDGAHLAADEYWRGAITMRLIADWSRLKARGVSARAFERQPTAPLYWVANDLMALGVLDTFERTRKVPGVDTLIGCFNWTPWALKKVAEGRITFVKGGHFMEVGTALAMLFDHSRGRDFADTGTSYTSSYALVTERNVRAVFQRLADRDFSGLDFRRFSRVLNPQRTEYEMDPMGYLRAIQ